MTTVTFRTDEKIKKQAADLFEEMGLSLSAAINAFLRQAVRLNRFPCELDADVTGKRRGCPPEILALYGSCDDIDIPEVDDDLSKPESLGL